MKSADEAYVTPEQHTTPCEDCPWRRTSMPGWTGEMTPADWVTAAHRESKIDCHVRTQRRGAHWECAGAAIYRANVAKRTRTPTLTLPKDREAVFANPQEFIDHHES